MLKTRQHFYLLGGSKEQALIMCLVKHVNKGEGVRHLCSIAVYVGKNSVVIVILLAKLDGDVQRVRNTKPFAVLLVLFFNLKFSFKSETKANVHSSW